MNKILVNKTKNLTYEDLNKLSQEELVNKVLQLQAHNIQLKNIIGKLNEKKEIHDTKNSQRKIDFTKCQKQHILLRFFYLGWDYQGYACQEDSPETVEHYLMKALLTCQLIESRETSDYNRCGRTDKGVSSFGQVISVTVRANGEGKPPLDYCKMLNRLLPDNIRILSWRPAPSEFSARFNCDKRMYRYFFPKSNLDLNKMNEAAQHLLGVHDFRNLCKMDIGNGVTNFIRSVESATISQINNRSGDINGYGMCQLELIGKAFLWHQVRCIMAVLILVGQHLEKPSVISELLDIEKNPRKPQYSMAHPIGLNLYKCYFENIEWNIDKPELVNVIGSLQRLWTEHKIKTTQIESMLTDLEKELSEPVYQHCSGVMKKESNQYKELLHRNKCNSVEDRIQHYVKKRKLEIQEVT